MDSDACSWLLTWTTYGTWLPGDRRGSTSPIRAGPETHERRNAPGESAAPPQPRLEQWARARMSEPEVRLATAHANVLLDQFRETARFRDWTLLACAVMRNHVHVVIQAGAHTPSATLLRDMKGYGSRALNSRFGSRRWWTKSGSCRRLRSEANVLAATRYVRAQYRPLLVWTDEGLSHPDERA